MKPSKRQSRKIDPVWADLLRRHIESKGRGYQAKMERETGCSAAMINRIKNATIGGSEWVDVLAVYTGIPVPPPFVDGRQAEMLNLSEKMSDREKDGIINMMRIMLGESAPANDEAN